MNGILSVILVVGVVLGGFFAFMKISNVLSRKSEDNEDNNYAPELISIAIQVALLLLVFIGYSTGMNLLATCLLIFLVASLFVSIFRVPDVFVGLPSSLFSGRVCRNCDDYGFSKPIRKPYKEGLHYKPFWWKAQLFNRKVRQLVLNRQEYQIGSGGTILVTGLVQYRISDVATYRAAEIGESEVQAGLGSEVDQFIIKKLGAMDYNSADISSNGIVDVDTGLDQAIQTRAELSQELEQKLKSKHLLTEDGEITRYMFEREISYAEQGYGAEVLTARIDKVDPSDTIRRERDRIQEERYQVRSERIQLQHFLNRVNDTIDSFEKKGLTITAEKATEIVQLSMKLTTKDIKEWQIGGAEGLLQLVTDMLKERRKGGER